MAFVRVSNRRGNSKDQRTVIFFCIIWIFYPRLTLYPSTSPLSDLEVCRVQDSDFSAEVFHSPETFKKDYMDMESKFKIFMYPQTDNDIVCDKQRRLYGKHASEGYFFQNLDQSQFLTTDPEKAHLFLVPVHCHKLHAERRSSEETAVAVQNFVNSLISKYPYWNRTLGADHFFVICHDRSTNGTQRISHLVRNSIRVVCSPSYNVQYVPHKDISLPQIQQPFTLPPSGNNVTNRTALAFWAGRLNSHIRDVLIQAWQNDTELDIQKTRMKLWRIRGHKVHGTPRIAEAIHYGCVPGDISFLFPSSVLWIVFSVFVYRPAVILADHYILPFIDILDWRKFSVLLKENDVYQLKEILKDIPDSKYRFFQDNTVKVQKHFQWNSPPVSFDAFHMVMYDLWLRRHVVKY
ncbi:unnamed protein product [Dovyalis caffra]|uniref:Exostosin GT47 domain-containing protein n=1 Tax=Dovyalis caffra TaxID=77055 RepID=A0AAV1SNT7_9ROSI|nr:unnamed protein product [Dovyalis caffra]